MDGGRARFSHPLRDGGRGAYLEGELGRATGSNGTQGAPEMNAGGQRAGRQQHRGLWERSGQGSGKQRAGVGKWKELDTCPTRFSTKTSKVSPRKYTDLHHNY